MRRELAVLLSLVLLAASCTKKTETPASGYSKPAGSAAAKPAAAKEGVDTGSKMPAYTAVSLDGSKFDMAAEHGNVVMLNLWATWCGPCRYEIPELQKLHDQYAPKGFKVVGVSVDEGDAKIVREFVAEQKMTYPVVHDPDGKLAVMFDASILPTTILVDRAGTIVWKHIGIVSGTDEEMLEALRAAIEPAA